ncbi:RnfABCDGE type electron transport complex subunit D [Ferruginibacter sp.]|nr:Na+-transporting NADH:ubiquinone oxidoreductase, subunit NqrB [Ferruginibacter sp.]
MFLQKLFKDARYFQILFQTIFLSYGILFLHWQAAWWLYSTYFITSITTQLVFEYFLGKKTFAYNKRIAFSFPSVIISSFGLSLLLKTNHVEIAALAAFISIASKFIIKIKGKHIFNPSALGIVTAIFLTDTAWFSPGQWGSGTVILFGVCCLGFIVVTRVQKLDISLTFLGTFAGLLFIRQIIYLGWPIDFFVQSISTGSLLLFSFFMITDPKTIPDNKWARIVWCIAIAAVAFYLTTFKFINGAPIVVLILAQPLVPLLDWLFKARRFQWTTSPKYNTTKNDFLHIVHTRSIM